MPHFEWIALDADDTLWHNERLYTNAQAVFVDLLVHYHDPDWVRARLYQTETRNLAHFGYGVKAFALSMIETAVELTEGRITGQDIQALIGVAKGMLEAEVELLEHVAETVPELAANHRLMVVTKGDLLDQERKMTRSGLGGYFEHIEVVSHKTRERYERLLATHAISPAHFLMVGNSLRSDILPILELGGHAVYVPYETTWEHEAADLPAPGTTGFYQLGNLGELPGLLARLERA